MSCGYNCEYNCEECDVPGEIMNMMLKRKNCEHRHTNGNCLFNGGFCLANDEEHCVRINEIKAYNQALEDVLKLIATLGIDWEVKNSDIDWLEKSVERLRK